MNTTARNCALLGLTMEQIGTVLSVSGRTVYSWVARYPSFGDAIREGRAAADSTVARRLYERACGYRTQETHTTKTGDKISVRTVTKQVAADTTACIFWLCNRQSDLWSRADQALPTAPEPLMSEEQRDQLVLARKIAFVMRRAASSIGPDDDRTLN